MLSSCGRYDSCHTFLLLNLLLLISITASTLDSLTTAAILFGCLVFSDRNCHTFGQYYKIENGKCKMENFGRQDSLRITEKLYCPTVFKNCGKAAHPLSLSIFNFQISIFKGVIYIFEFVRDFIGGIGSAIGGVFDYLGKSQMLYGTQCFSGFMKRFTTLLPTSSQ